MSTISRLFNFTSETLQKIKSSEVDAELNQLVATINNLELVNLKAGATGLAAGSFSAYRNAAYSIPNGGAVIPWDSEEWDESGWFSVANGRFTPLVAGIYRFTARVLALPGSGGGEIVELYKNGAALKQIQALPAVSQSGARDLPASSVLAQANGATDFFEVHVTNGTGSAFTLTAAAGASYFQGELVGKL